jgi:predicted acyltransferase
MGGKDQAPSGRLPSIDALRGFDMFWIVGGEEAAKALAKWAGEPEDGLIHTQLEHVEWAGFHFYDLIFPLFLFLVGVVIPFSLDKHRAGGESRAALYWRIARRTALLFALGLVYNNFLQFDFANQRYAGVLQRIAICYGVAALIVLHTGVRTQAAITAALLLGYWALLAFGPGDYTKAGNWPGAIDRQFLPGKIYDQYYGFGDNEGILSTIPAVATALLGALAGHWLRAGRPAAVKVLGLALAGLVSLGLGWAWDLWFPVIKILWTSSYVLVAGGWSLLLLALFYGIIDGLGWRRWAFFFTVIGVNAITIYLLHRIIGFEHLSHFLLGGVARLSGSFGPVVLAVGVLALEWLLLLYLYRRRIFLRV